MVLSVVLYRVPILKEALAVLAELALADRWVFVVFRSWQLFGFLFRFLSLWKTRRVFAADVFACCSDLRRLRFFELVAFLWWIY